MFYTTDGYLSSKQMFSHTLAGLFLQHLGTAYICRYHYSESSSDQLHCYIISIDN